MADQPINPTSLAPETPAGDRGLQWAVGLLTVLVVLLIGFRWYTDRSRPRPTELTRDSHRIELNQATRSELMQLPGVGPSRADKILAYRTSKGGFQRVEELRSVDGIGDITLQRLKTHVEVNAVSVRDDEAVRLSRKPAEPARSSTGTKKPVPEGLINLNKASISELQRLPGIGPSFAQRIIDQRERQPFVTVEDLRRVSGIGAKKLEQIRPYVVIRE